MAEYPCCFRCNVLLLHFTPLTRCPGCGGPLSAIEMENLPQKTITAESAEERALNNAH